MITNDVFIAFGPLKLQKTLCRLLVKYFWSIFFSFRVCLSLSTIAKESSTNVEVNCSLQLNPLPISSAALNENADISAAENEAAISERVGLGNVFKQFFK